MPDHHDHAHLSERLLRAAVLLVDQIGHIEFVPAAADVDPDDAVVLQDLLSGLGGLVADLPLLVVGAVSLAAHFQGKAVQQVGIVLQFLQGLTQQVGHLVLLRFTGVEQRADDHVPHEQAHAHDEDEDRDHREGGGDGGDPAASSAVLLLVVLLLRLGPAALTPAVQGGIRFLPPAGGAARRLRGRRHDHRGLVQHVLTGRGDHRHGGILAKLLQVLQHGLGGGIALVQIGGHGLQGDSLQGRRDVRVEIPGRNGNGTDVLNGHVDRIVPLIGKPAGEHLIEDHAGGVDVGAAVHMAALGLLRGDIVDRADGLGGHGVLGGAGDAGDAEIGDLHAAVPQDQHVLGLDVPVDDAPAVGVIQSPQDLGDEVDSLPPVQRGPPLAQILLEGHAVDQFHDDVVQPVGAAHVIHGDDIGVGQHGNGLGLIVEPAADVGVAGQFRL